MMTSQRRSRFLRHLSPSNVVFHYCVGGAQHLDLRLLLRSPGWTPASQGRGLRASRVRAVRRRLADALVGAASHILDRPVRECVEGVAGGAKNDGGLLNPRECPYCVWHAAEELELVQLATSTLHWYSLGKVHTARRSTA